jgi:hypothetical protein
VSQFQHGVIPAGSADSGRAFQAVLRLGDSATNAKRLRDVEPGPRILRRQGKCLLEMMQRFLLRAPLPREVTELKQHMQLRAIPQGERAAEHLSGFVETRCVPQLLRGMEQRQCAIRPLLRGGHEMGKGGGAVATLSRIPAERHRVRSGGRIVARTQVKHCWSFRPKGLFGT